MLEYLAALYVSASLILFFFPSLLHPKKKCSNKIEATQLNTDKVALVAHRGGSREYLENTLEAFRHAVNLGVNVLEMDVCMTKDKKIVVVHDNDLSRMCGVKKFVPDFNYSDLPPIQDTVLIDFTIHQKRDTKTAKTKYFPLFEDILKEFPDTLLNVEIKTPDDEFLNLMNQLVLKYNAENRIVWGCRSPLYNLKLYKINKNVKRFMNEQVVFKVYFYFFLGLLPFISIDEDSFQFPMYTKDFHHWKRLEAKTKLQKLIVEIQFGIIRFFNLANHFLFYHFRLRGIITYLWVLNMVEEFEQALKYKVQGIMTDAPTLLLQVLKKHSKYIDNKFI